MFGHFVERMLMGGGGGGSGGGGGGGSSHPGRPGGESGERGLGSSSSSRGGGGYSVSNNNSSGFSGLGSGGFSSSNANKSVGGGSSIRGGGDGGTRVDNRNSSGFSGLGSDGFNSSNADRSIAGSETISGSGNARAGFSLSVRDNPDESTRTIRGIGSVQTNNFRRARNNMTTLDQDPADPVFSMSTIGASESQRDRFSFSPNVRDPNQSSVSTINNKSVEARARAREAGLDAANVGLPGQAASFGAGLLAGPFGSMAAKGIRNSMVANELSDELQTIAAETDYALNANVDDLRNALNTEAINDSTFGILGDTERYGIESVINATPVTPSELSATPRDITPEDAARMAEESRVDWGEPPERTGGGGEYVPPPAPIGPPSGPVTAQRPRFGIGRLGNYSSYARRVFSRV